MERNELIEWIIIILCVIAWWPLIFMGYNPLWYHLLLYYVTPLVLIGITVRRYRRMKAGLAYSEQVAKSPLPGQPAPLEPPKKGK